MMRRFILAAVSVAALAVPSIASALPMQTNSTTKDAIGFCVSAGNYNYLNGVDTSFPSTGANRSSFAGTPGAVADLISGARASCAALESTYPLVPPPGQ